MRLTELTGSPVLHELRYFNLVVVGEHNVLIEIIIFQKGGGT
jgi:hypothetical protein